MAGCAERSLTEWFGPLINQKKLNLSSFLAVILFILRRMS